MLVYVLPWTVESFPFMLWRWRNKLKMSPAPAQCTAVTSSSLVAGLSATQFATH